MDFDAIGTGLDGAPCREAEVGHRLAHLIGCQRARHGNVLHALGREHPRTRRDGRRCDGLAMMRRIVRVGHASGVHQLDEDVATLDMYRISDLLPAGDMGVGVNARRGHVALSVVRGLGAFRDNQAGAGALAVILGGQFSRRTVELGTAAGHRRHGQAVLQGVTSKLDGGE